MTFLMLTLFGYSQAGGAVFRRGWHAEPVLKPQTRANTGQINARYLMSADTAQIR